MKVIVTCLNIELRIVFYNLNIGFASIYDVIKVKGTSGIWSPDYNVVMTMTE